MVAASVARGVVRRQHGDDLVLALRQRLGRLQDAIDVERLVGRVERRFGEQRRRTSGAARVCGDRSSIRAERRRNSNREADAKRTAVSLGSSASDAVHRRSRYGTSSPCFSISSGSASSFAAGPSAASLPGVEHQHARADVEHQVEVVRRDQLRAGQLADRVRSGRAGRAGRGTRSARRAAAPPAASPARPRAPPAACRRRRAGTARGRRRRAATRPRASASSARAFASSGVAPRFSGPNATSSSTVGLKSWSSGFWNTMPMVSGSFLRCAGSAGSRPHDARLARACPASTPHSRRNSVVLPAPFGPTSATHSPGPTANVTSSSATRPSA